MCIAFHLHCISYHCIAYYLMELLAIDLLELLPVLSSAYPETQRTCGLETLILACNLSLRRSILIIITVNCYLYLNFELYLINMTILLVALFLIVLSALLVILYNFQVFI